MLDDCMIDDPIDFEYEDQEDDGLNDTNPVLRAPGHEEAATTPPSSGKYHSKWQERKKISNLFWRR